MMNPILACESPCGAPVSICGLADRLSQPLENGDPLSSVLLFDNAFLPGITTGCIAQQQRRSDMGCGMIFCPQVPQAELAAACGKHAGHVVRPLWAQP